MALDWDLAAGLAELVEPPLDLIVAAGAHAAPYTCHTVRAPVHHEAGRMCCICGAHNTVAAARACKNVFIRIDVALPRRLRL